MQRREVFQESCAQPITILYLGEGPSSAEELKESVRCTPSGGTKTLLYASLLFDCFFFVSTGFVLQYCSSIYTFFKLIFIEV